MEPAKTEARTIKTHPQLLLDVITRQAGTLSKAILEGIMNSADAGATFCDVTIDADKMSITDDGKGFRNRDEIINFFETFGTPHTESEGKKYGTFRMGRGQIFAFGSNEWRTGVFQMRVDIKTRGFDYDLETLPQAFGGCKIDVKLYNPLLPSDVHYTVREVKKMAKYVPLILKVNGEVSSVDPSTETWDQVTNEAYVSFASTTSLGVYNLGVWVKDFGNWQFGCGGTVVSRKQLKLNFARNDIMSECPVWNKVRKLVDQKATERNKDKLILDDGERQRLADQIKSGALGGARAGVLKLFTDVTGRHVSAEKLARMDFANWVTVAPLGDMRGDKLMQSKTAFVFANETLERFQTTLRGLIDIIKGCGQNYWAPSILAYENATRGMSEAFNTFSAKEMTARERVFERLYDTCFYTLSCGLGSNRGDSVSRRQFCIGKSDAAIAWTDGSSFVTFNREYLARLDFNYEGMMQFFGVALHELCHGDCSSSTHIHEFEFYKTFHDNRENIFRSVEKAVGALPAILESEGRKLTAKQLKMQDKLVKLERAAKKHPEFDMDNSVRVKPVKPAIPVREKEVEDGWGIAAEVPFKAENPQGNPYRASSGYGLLFALASQKDWDKADLLAAASKASGKSVELIANDLAVLSNPNHRSNGQRSKLVKVDGRIRIDKVEKVDKVEKTVD